MMKLTNRFKVVSNKTMSLGEKIYLPAIFSGMGITLKHALKKNQSTIRYPEQRKLFSKVWRGKHILRYDEEGKERCTACGLCALACPAEAITMTAKERTKEQEHLYREEKYAETYEIDMLRCIFCGMCEEACPKSAIYLTDELVKVEQERAAFVYGKDQLLEDLNNRYDITSREKKSYE